MERLLRLFPVLLLATLAALTYWLDQAMQSPPAKAEDRRLLHHPDFTVENLLATRMDVNGRIRDTLRASKMVHYPDDDSTELEQPRFVSLARGTPLTITSRTALVTSNAGNIHFRGDVRADRAAQAGKSAMTLTTDYLHYLPDDNIVRTDRRVIISDANMRLEAVGMELNGETRVLKLFAGVRGVYHDVQTIANANRAASKR